MPVLYLIEQGTTLHKSGDVFTVTKKGEVLQEIRAIEVAQIIVLGNIDLTTPAINYILKQGIDCVFCNSYGRYHGRLVSTESKLGVKKTLYYPPGGREGRGLSDSQMSFVAPRARGSGLVESVRLLCGPGYAKERIFCGGVR
jgi:hypothetical protein